MTPIPLGTLFQAGRDGGAAIATRDGEPLRPDRFAADVGHVAAAVRAAGARRGAVVSADPYRFLVGLFGLLHAKALAIVPPDGLAATLVDLRDAFDVLLTDEPPPAWMPHLPIEAARGPASPLEPLEPLDADAAGMLFFTSGSSGSAKRVAKTLAMFDREIAALHAVWGDAAGAAAVLSTVPFRHIFGLTFHLLWPLASGRPFVSHMDEHWESVLARDLANAVLVTSPAHLSRLGGVARLAPRHGPALVFTAGAPLRANDARAAADTLGTPPTEIFGSTETGAIATRVQHAAAEPWTPLPGVGVTSDEGGHMVVRSPWGPPGEPFTSADRIEMTAEGKFHFLGRDDRVAKIAGVRVSLPRLEDELLALPWVADAAVAVLEDTHESLAAAVVPNDEGRARLDDLGAFRFSRELRRRLAVRLESAWLPKTWRFLDRLPRDSLGKRRDADVRALFAPEAGTAR